MGRLQRLQYLNCNRLPYNASSEAKDSIISIWKKYEPYSEVLNYIISSGRFANRYTMVTLPKLVKCQY